MSDIKLVRSVTAENPVEHDLELASGQLQWVGMDLYDSDEQSDMIAQRVNCRLLYIRGEWYLDQNEGTPWRVLWAKGTTVARMERIFRTVITGTPGIASVTRLLVTRSPATRHATVEWTARADTGAQIGPSTLDTPFIVRET